MRAVTVVWLAGCVVACTVARAEPQFPYEVTVGADGVEVRSGPGRDYYATGRLEAGSKIQVYRHDRGGWLAIRPPLGSFSLVEQSHLQTSNERGLARVRRDGIECRVGSSVSEVESYVTHVQLRNGELVELFRPAEDGESAAADADSRWVPIWPPAGEFRWVHRDDVGGPESASDESDRTGQSAANDDPQASATEADHGSDGWELRPLTRPTRSPAETASRSREKPPLEEGSATSRPGSGESESQIQGKQQRVPEQSETVRVPPEREQTSVAKRQRTAAATRPAEPEEKPEDDPRSKDVSDTPPRKWVSRSRATGDDLDSLELDLAMMVAREMRAWRLDSLSDRVRETLSRLDDESERVRARRLLARISEFEHLLNRASAALENGSTDDSTGATVSGDAAGAASGNTVAGVTYDGTGWLVPVHASKGTVPPYALLDAQGDVLQYISPTPGLNLQRYVRKQIGIFGNRGYIPSLNKPHVTAQRVVDLDRHLR
jgi:hypothetical protein